MPYYGVDITVSAHSDVDDGLKRTADEYVREHPDLARYDLAARWTDDRRQTVTLHVPVSFVAEHCTITAFAASETTSDSYMGIDVPFTIAFDGFSHDGKVTHTQHMNGSYGDWGNFDRPTLNLMEELDPYEWGELNDAILVTTAREAERFAISNRRPGSV